MREHHEGAARGSAPRLRAADDRPRRGRRALPARARRAEPAPRDQRDPVPPQHAESRVGRWSGRSAATGCGSSGAAELPARAGRMAGRREGRGSGEMIPRADDYATAYARFRLERPRALQHGARRLRSPRRRPRAGRPPSWRARRAARGSGPSTGSGSSPTVARTSSRPAASSPETGWRSCLARRWRPRSRTSRASSAARCRCRSSRSSVSRTSSSGSPTARRGVLVTDIGNFARVAPALDRLPHLETVFTVDGETDGARDFWRELERGVRALRDSGHPRRGSGRAPLYLGHHRLAEGGSSTRNASSSATSREWTSRTTTSARPGDRLWVAGGLGLDRGALRHPHARVGTTAFR